MGRPRVTAAGPHLQIGSRLLEVRQRTGLSQAAFAQRLGVTGRGVGLIESGHRRPSVTLLAKLREVFGVEPAEIILGQAEEATELTSGVEELKKRIVRQGLDEEAAAKLAPRAHLYELVDGEGIDDKTLARICNQWVAGPGNIEPVRMWYLGLSLAQRETVKNLIRVLHEVSDNYPTADLEQIRQWVRSWSPHRLEHIPPPPPTQPRRQGRPPTVSLFRIAAGGGIEAIQGTEEVEVPTEVAQDLRGCYALRVQGDSMTEDGIFDGDIILVRHQPAIPEGQIVVARRVSANVVTLKRYYRRRDEIELRPGNHSYDRMCWPAGDTEIDGCYVGAIKRARRTKS